MKEVAMLSLFEPAALFGKSGADSAMKLSSSTIGYAERLIKIQVDTINEMVNDNNENLKAIFSKPGNAGVFEYWQATYQANIEKTMEFGRRYAAEIAKIQTEMAQLMGEVATSVNQSAFKNLEDFTKSAMEESEKAARIVEHPAKSKRTS
jgi:hypothetical protein